MRTSKFVWISAAVLGLIVSSARGADPQIKHAEKHVLTTHTQYDAIGNVVTLTGAGTAGLVYDSSGTMSTVNGGNTAIYRYDGQDNLVTSTSGPVSYTYEEIGNDSRTINAVNNIGTYDTNGNTVIDSDGVGSTFSYTYNAQGAGSTIDNNTDLGRTTRYDYNPLNMTTQVMGTDPLGNVTRYEYDNGLGRVQMTDAIGGVNNTDNNSTTSSGSIEMGFTTSYTYQSSADVMTNLAGSSLTVTLYDETANTTVYTYSASDTDALGRVTLYTYDPIGGANMGTLTGPLQGTLQGGHVYRYEYQYNLNQNVPQTGTGNLTLDLNLAPQPEPGIAGVIFVAALFGRRRRII